MVMNFYPGFPAGMMHVVPDRMRQSLIEHREILATIGESDLDGVKTTMERHLRNSCAALAAYLGEDQALDPFELEVD
jgi:DNA-binding GntR family transcriptional regulator